MTNASYSGGIIITEWFSAENNTENTNRELKLTVRFMSNEIRADAITQSIEGEHYSLRFPRFKNFRGFKEDEKI